MADHERPTGDDRARTRRKSGEYFMLPSEQAEQFKRTEADLERRAIDADAHPPGKDDD